MSSGVPYWVLGNNSCQEIFSSIIPPGPNNAAISKNATTSLAVGVKAIVGNTVTNMNNDDIVGSINGVMILKAITDDYIGSINIYAYSLFMDMIHPHMLLQQSCPFTSMNEFIKELGEERFDIGCSIQQLIKKECAKLPYKIDTISNETHAVVQEVCIGAYYNTIMDVIQKSWRIEDALSILCELPCYYQKSEAYQHDIERIIYEGPHGVHSTYLLYEREADYVCERCGNSVDSDDFDTNVLVSRGSIDRHEGWCDYCVTEHSVYVDGYGNVCRDLATIDDNGNGIFRENAIDCDECCGTFHTDDTIDGPDGMDYCHDCFNKIFTECGECGELCSDDQIVELEGRSICLDCYDEHYFECMVCGEMLRSDEKFGEGRLGSIICSDCLEEEKTEEVSHDEA